jgi:predicted outer membrane protein
MTRQLTLALVGVALAAASPASAQQLLPFPGLADPAESTMAFRAEALRSDAYEIDASRMALQKSNDPRVRAHARQLIAEHQRTTDALLPPGTSLNAAGNVVRDGEDNPFASPIGILTAPLTVPVNIVGRTFEGRPLIDNDPATPGRRVALDPRRQQMLSRLEQTPPGRRFNAVFANQQVSSHREAVNLYKSYAENGNDPEAVTFAKQVLPRLEDHYAMATRLQERYAGDEPAM